MKEDHSSLLLLEQESPGGCQGEGLMEETALTPLPEEEGWADVAGEAGVVEGAAAGSGVEGEEAVAVAGS